MFEYLSGAMFPSGSKRQHVAKKTLDTQGEVRKLMSQVNPALEMARALASIQAPAQALKDLGKTFASHPEMVKSITSASEIARHLTQHSDFVKLTEALPRVDLQLPNIASTIKASLPKPLAGPALQSSEPLSAVSEEACSKSFPQTDVSIHNTEDLGQMVKRVRERRKQSQQEFADLAGVGRRFLSELENGKQTLEFAKVLQVAHAAGLSLIVRDRSL